VIETGASSILFQSFFVRRGSSGGALFNRWWEVVGMVTKDEPPLGHAIPIDTVLAQVKVWGFPVALKQPSFPRGGYRTTVGAVVMTPTSSVATTGDTRVPSGRVTIVRQMSPLVTWHLAGLNWPRRIAVTAGMADWASAEKSSRLPGPFVEPIGVESRLTWSYFVAASDGTREVPIWSRVVGDGLGIGGGMSLEMVVFAPAVLEVSAGYWGFTRPDSAATLDKVFLGAGMRLGL
jgi:hypothetical protein